ncbi:MAG: VWA domain-containing protein, partial [Rubripirellula sp.]|nr:VWA domain-containing protein [Rubripirellula sp.]
MFGLRLGFEQPIYLLLLAILPLIWWMGAGPLRVLGPVRRWLAMSLRTILWLMVVLALAGVQWVWTSDRMTVMYILDQSESIPASKRQLMLDYVIDSVREHRNREREDRAGIIVFGRQAAIEIPPFDDDIPEIGKLESLQTPVDATNLESALNLAQASMPEDTARRIVIITDGNENMGQASAVATRLTQSGIGIDIVPIVLDTPSEVVVEKIDLPSDLRKGQPFEARVVLSQYSDRENPQPVSGKIRIKQSVRGEESLLMEEPLVLNPGKNVVPIQHQIDQPAAYVYEAEFIPDTSQDDAIRKNNAATAYTYVKGSGRVLLIQEASRAGDYDLLIQSLRDANIEVVNETNERLFGSLAELQAYDAVILAGVPRVSGEESSSITSFSDEQIDMLVSNTQQLGAGLLMIGGPEAFGAGGWTGTKLEKAMPVDFQIKNSKVKATGALALIMHASEMPQGNYWQKVIAKAAIEQLGPSDYAGVLHWTMRGDAWLWGGTDGNLGMLEVGGNRQAMLARIGKMTPGDMPQFEPAMKMAVAGLAACPAAVKHCVIISDGDPSPPNASTIQAFINNKISISTVAVASHGLTESKRLQDIAEATGGKYYSVADGRALPRIFQREARRVSRPLVYEPDGGAVPQIIFPHESMLGIDKVLPPITGFVLTQTKDSPLAQVLIQSPKPESPENATIAATWTYGLGRTAVITTDAGARWAASWSNWDGYQKLHSQIVRWLMRPTGDTGQFSISSTTRDGEVEVVVNALSDDDAYLNFLDVQATVIAPDLTSVPLRLRQSAPGRYVGSFPATQTGSYFVNVIPGIGNPPLSTGVSVPYSSEYRIRKSNLSLIDALAGQAPTGGTTGQVFPALDTSTNARNPNANPFRAGLAPARRMQDAWPWFVLVASCVLLGDIFIRRVAIRLDLLTAQGKMQQKASEADLQKQERLSTLGKTKQQLAKSMRQKSEGRFKVTQSDQTAQT